MRKKVKEVPWNLWDVAKVLFFVLLLMILSYFLRVSYPRQGPPFGQPIVAALVSVFIYAILILFIWNFGIKKYKGTFRHLGLRSFALWEGFKACLIWLTVVKLLGVLYLILTSIFGLKLPPEQVERLPEVYGTGWFGVTLAIVTTAIVAPLGEEVFFRGFIYPVFRRRIGVTGAILTTAIIFALFHLNLWEIIPLIVVGIVLAYLYEKWGSLGPPIILHFLHNLLSIFIIYFYLK